MHGVSREQIDAAKKMSAIEFLRRYRPEELEYGGSRGEYQLRHHDSFKINGQTSLWHWKSRDIGGKSALDYLVHVEGVGFVDAVRALCDERPTVVPLPVIAEKQKRFVLPQPAKHYHQVFAYLLGRGISQPVIEACMHMRILYESADYHNAVFVGKDDSGVPRYAFLRGTYSKPEKPFRGEVAGSNKEFSFCIPANGRVSRVAVYEAAIDAMAHWTLEGTQNKYRLSLGGIYAPKTGEVRRGFQSPRALEAFLIRHPEIEEIEVCTDRDAAGRFAAEHIIGAYGDKYQMIDNPPDLEQGDYADLAQQKMKERGRAARNRAERSR